VLSVHEHTGRRRQDVLLDQLFYAINLDGKVTKEEKETLAEIKAQVAKIGGSFTPIINGTDGTIRWGVILESA
jgi:hypothetical protein